MLLRLDFEEGRGWRHSKLLVLHNNPSGLQRTSELRLLLRPDLQQLLLLPQCSHRHRRRPPLTQTQPPPAACQRVILGPPIIHIGGKGSFHGGIEPSTSSSTKRRIRLRASSWSCCRQERVGGHLLLGGGLLSYVLITQKLPFEPCLEVWNISTFHTLLWNVSLAHRHTFRWATR